MAAKGKADTFSNVAALSVVESAANTQTAIKFNFPFSIMDKMALIIQRIEYIMQGLGQLNTSLDYTIAAITVGATLTDMRVQTDPLMVDSCMYTRIDIGAAASGSILRQPFIKDFTNLAGGGLLVAPNPLYGMVQANGAGGVTSCWFRLFYTYIEMNTDEYWQLVESRRIISS